MPDRVKIGDSWYSVKVDSHRIRELTDDEPWAYIHYGTLEILLLDGLVEQFKKQAVWHEIKHGVFKLAGVSYKAKLTDEQAILHSARLELMVLQENPALVKWFLS